MQGALGAAAASGLRPCYPRQPNAAVGATAVYDLRGVLLPERPDRDTTKGYPRVC